MSNCDIISSPIKFLGATVLSFNCSLGLGSSESSLNIDLIEDCESVPPDAFWPPLNINNIGVGAPVYFNAGQFYFGGVLTNWTVNQGSSGKTFNVKVVDPRQLLENAIVITDSYLGPPEKGLNYYNVYAYWESKVLEDNCSVFGDSFGGERGMPYKKVIQALTQMEPTIYSPTGYRFTIDFNTFPQNLPDYYRVAGPSNSILQLLQDVCDVSGFDFYVTLQNNAIISIGLIDLKNPPPSFNTIIQAYNGTATELSYGQELRNEVTKTIVFGEHKHYLSKVTKFNYFFGEDLIGNTYVPIVPYKYDACGFWIKKKVDSLNLTLNKPLPNNGPFTIHELDIRAAMASQDLWRERVVTESINGTFNKAVRDNWPEAIADFRNILKTLEQGSNAIGQTQNADLTIDGANRGGNAARAGNDPEFLEDIDKAWNFIKSLGENFYGKQFIAPLNQLICYYYSEDSNFAEKVFSDIPTNAGGWVENGTPVLGLNDPDLGLFREDDGRIGCFALFNNSGEAPDEEETTNEEYNDFNSEVNPPTNPLD